MNNAIRNIDSIASGSLANEKSVVLLLVQSAQDRELFKQFLPDCFTVKLDPQNVDNEELDLCIVDAYSVYRNQDWLAALKEKVAPIFLPVLLLSENQETVQKNGVLSEFADDVVYIPASSKLLKSRIQLLLKQREYSLKLEEKNNQLAKKNKELAEEKRKYQLITENSTDMISRHAPDGTYLYVSPACKELTGYEPEYFIGRNPVDNMHPQDRKIFENAENLFSDDEIVRFSFRKKTVSGEYKWVESIMRTIVDEDTGDVIEIQATTRDISDRKEFEHKLKEEKDFVDKAIKSLPELFYMIDEDHNFIKWNNIERVLGYSDEDMKDMHPFDLFRNEDQGFISNKIQEVFETGAGEAEVMITAKSGELVPYYITARKFTRGDTNFIVGSGINLTEIKEAQYDLEQQRQLLDAIINQSKSLIFVKDQDKKYRLVNDSYMELFDRSREDIIGKSVREVHGPEFEKQVVGNDEAVLKHGKTVETEEAIPVDGETRYYHSIKYPLKGVPGFENCLCGISTDITDLKKASNQLQERIKEQRCLYDISSLPEQSISIDELLQKAVNYLPGGLQYPEVAEAAITFGNETYQTDDYCATSWQLSAESNRIEGKTLKLNLVYTEEQPRADEGPFLYEERQLIDSVIDTLSSQIDRIITNERLKESKNRWEKLVKNDPDLIMILADREIKFVNQAGAQILGGGTPEQIMGKYLDDVVGVENMELVEKREQKLLEGEPVEPVVHQFTGLDDKVRYVKTQSTPITYEGNENAIQIVGQDVTDRIEYERELKESLKEKETLLQEIHHRVKNNLAVVSGMLQLQAFNSENEELRKSLKDSESRIKTMALIHEQLYQSQSLSQIDFGQYVEELISNIREVSVPRETIDITLDFDSFNLNVNQAVPCALIINEVISNSFEHAFTEQKKGHINLQLKKRNNKIQIIISDNGKGLPSDYDQKESMGFTIISTLITQLNADYNIDRENGTTISFSFKKQDIKGSSSTLI